MLKKYYIAKNSILPAVTGKLSWPDDAMGGLTLSLNTIVKFCWVDGNSEIQRRTGKVTDVATKAVQYDWSITDTSNAGVFGCWWEVNFGTEAAPKILRCPNNRRLVLEIAE